ncbi:beta-glucosidase [Nocardioides scoriae]|uniref:Exo-alpha-(1->6)-L-arabinopyranosidase n=1 Tax=Nocardioides scoriae TaxID=642780 RepID=A0A1H1VHR2_9ACTN|nr:glycoside hydrolase family 3 C-terminal domain-containing protein [Nocardioides scoriae]SDS84292.1 beta-glucosidase [Nocardioides scoriae]
MTHVHAGDLTLEEKAGLLSGRDFWTTQPIDRADVASIVLTDGPHGVRRQAAAAADHLGENTSQPATCFPPAVAVGSSWDPDVAEQIGEAVGREARALGVHVVLGPGVNMKRSPLCGRNFEYYSEDPLLAGVLATAHVRAQQAQGVGAALKHFAANNQETERMRVSADVDMRTLREIYLPAFERVVAEAAPATIMCAYNKLNGVYAAENRWLLTDLLRDEWGFEGAVISDWGAVHDPVASLIAGLDLEMPGTGGKSSHRIVEAVNDGTLDESIVDAAVNRVLALTRQTTEHAPESDARTAGDLDLDAHHSLARTLAAQCAVLLKNNDALPLAPGARIGVIGEFARTPRFQGGGSSRVNATRVDVPLTEIQARGAEHGCEIVFTPGYTSADVSSKAGNSEEMLQAAAVAVARSVDVAVVFAGLAEPDESEGFDRADLALSTVQVELIRAVARSAKRTVVVLSNGGVVAVEGWHEEVDGILETHLLGQAGGGAVADLLFGVTNPSGRLAETVPARLTDTASYVNFPGEQGHVRYGEGVMVGYRWHETVGIKARYPFGHGLSYTTFATSELSTEVTGPGTVEAKVTVTNTGDRAGAHVVQVYVSTTAGPVRRPVRELRGFAKVHLEPGEARTVPVRLDRRAFAYWDVERAGWAVAPGAHTVQVCQDAATVQLEQTVDLAGDAWTHELTFDSTVEEWHTHPTVGPALLTALATGVPSDSNIPAPTPELLRMIGSMPMQKVVDMLGDAVPLSMFQDLLALSRPATGAAATQGAS